MRNDNLSDMHVMPGAARRDCSAATSSGLGLPFLLGELDGSERIERRVSP